MAEEVVQDAFLAVHQRSETIDNPGGYLRRAVVNTCVRWRRRRDHERRLLVVAGEPPPTGDPSIDTMWDAIRRLRPERRAVVVVRYWEDLPPGLDRPFPAASRPARPAQGDRPMNDIDIATDAPDDLEREIVRTLRATVDQVTVSAGPFRPVPARAGPRAGAGDGAGIEHPPRPPPSPAQ